MQFTLYAQMLRKVEPALRSVIKRLPPDSPLLGSMLSILEAVGYRGFLDVVVPFGADAIRLFRALDPHPHKGFR